MMNVAIVLIIYQCIVFFFSYKSQGLVSDINKLLFFSLFILFIFWGKRTDLFALTERDLLLPSWGILLLPLFVGRHCNFLDKEIKSLSNYARYFPTLLLLIFMMSNSRDLRVLTYIFLFSSLFEFILSLEKKESFDKREILIPIFIISLLLVCLTFQINLTFHSVYILLWISIFRLFPFSLSPDRGKSLIHKNLLLKIIMIFFLSLGKVHLEAFDMLFLFFLLGLTLPTVVADVDEFRSLEALNAIISTTLLILYSYFQNNYTREVSSSLLWVQFYVSSLTLELSIKHRFSYLRDRFLRMFFFLLFSGIFIGSVSSTIELYFKTSQLAGEILQILIFVGVLLLPTIIFFNREDYKKRILSRLRKGSYYDAIMIHVVVALGLFLSL